MRTVKEVKLLEIFGEDGERLTVQRSNRGDPYRDGAELLVKRDYDTWCGVFLERHELERLRNHLNEMLNN